MTYDERVAEIQRFMSNDLADNLHAKIMKPSYWGGLVHLTNADDPHRPFGFTVPLYFPYDEHWSFLYCPEVMADVTRALSDQEIQEWLRWVRAHCNSHAVYPGLSEVEIDTQLEALFPEWVPVFQSVFEAMFHT